jgi:uncharacterized protein DUF1549/uncharacterized protein DUF1553
MNAGLFLALVSSAAPGADSSYRAIIDAEIDRAAAGRVVPLADDATFLRRVTLDLCGVVPEPGEVESFLADRRPDKRRTKIDELMSKPCAAAELASTWSAVLLGSFEPAKERRINRTLFSRWLAKAWTEDRPWDQVATDLICASGSPDVDGPVSFILSHGTLEELNGDISRIFMGVSIQCAECHDHPEQSITRRDYWEMAAFFSRTQFRIEKQSMIPEGTMQNLSPTMAVRLEREVERGKEYRRPVIVDRALGEVRIPDGDLVRPKFLTGEKPLRGDGRTQRRQLASFVTSKETGYFARALVDRMWAHYLGPALVDSPDDLGLEKCGSSGAEKASVRLLCALSRELEGGGYRVRPLVRGVLLSKAYQAATSREAAPSAGEPLGGLPIRGVKPLSPAQLYATFLQVTGVENAFDPGPIKKEQMKEAALVGLGQLFGEDDDKKNVAPIATVPLALTIMNGERLNRAIRPMRGGAIDRIFGESSNDEARVRGLFLSVLGRPPSDRELAAFVSALDGLGARPRRAREAYSDMLWAMINSTEFLYNY